MLSPPKTRNNGSTPLAPKPDSETANNKTAKQIDAEKDAEKEKVPTPIGGGVANNLAQAPATPLEDLARKIIQTGRFNFGPREEATPERAPPEKLMNNFAAGYARVAMHRMPKSEDVLKQEDPSIWGEDHDGATTTSALEGGTARIPGSNQGIPGFMAADRRLEDDIFGRNPFEFDGSDRDAMYGDGLESSPRFSREIDEKSNNDNNGSPSNDPEDDTAQGLKNPCFGGPYEPLFSCPFFSNLIFRSTSPRRPTMHDGKRPKRALSRASRVSGGLGAS